MSASGLHNLLLNVALQPRRLARSLNRWMPASAISQPLAVVALDGQWLKVLQVEGPRQARRITKLFAASVEGASPSELEPIIRDACAAQSPQPSEVLIANPSHLCTVRLFSLPSTDPKEIRDIVDLQAEKHTPYAKEEILTDFKVIDRDGSGYSRVLLVITHQDVVHRSVRLIESSRLILDRVGCELEGLLSFFRMLKRPSGGSAANAPALIVDVDGSTTTLILMQRQQPQFHRSLAIGMELLRQNPEQASERLLHELQRSLEAIEAEGASAKPQEVLLTGCVQKLGDLKSFLEQKLNLPVHLVSPWGDQVLSEAAQVMRERLPDVSFTGLLGLALGSNTLDLTPQATKLRHAFEAKAKALVLIGCQGVGVLVLASLLIMLKAQKEERYHQALRAVYQQAAQEASRVEDALQQIGSVQNQLSRHGELLEAAQTLAELSPSAIRWSALTYTQNEGIVLKGVSTELPKVYEVVASLESSALFERVEARRVAKRRSEEDLTDFEIICSLVSPDRIGSVSGE